jgi:hypothetical protein
VKNPEAEPVFYGIKGCASTELGGGGEWNDLILMKPAVGFMLPSAGVTPAPVEKERCGTSSLFELVGGSFALPATSSPAAYEGDVEKRRDSSLRSE